MKSGRIVKIEHGQPMSRLHFDNGDVVPCASHALPPTGRELVYAQGHGDVLLAWAAADSAQARAALAEDLDARPDAGAVEGGKFELQHSDPVDNPGVEEWEACKHCGGEMVMADIRYGRRWKPRLVLGCRSCGKKVVRS